MTNAVMARQGKILSIAQEYRPPKSSTMADQIRGAATPVKNTTQVVATAATALTASSSSDGDEDDFESRP
jgi:hypothetical protein